MKIASTLLLSLLLVCVSLQLSAQLIKWDVGKPLTWADFAGTIDTSNHYYAYTRADMGYTYKWGKSDRLFSYEFKINAGFNKDASWIRKGRESAELLKHEQLHFDISELHARKLLIAFNKKIYTGNYEQEIKNIYEKVLKDARDMQAKYDTETNHCLNKDKQQEWEIYVKQQLQQTPSY